jgi:hypothetical protein
VQRIGPFVVLIVKPAGSTAFVIFVPSGNVSKSITKACADDAVREDGPGAPS